MSVVTQVQTVVERLAPMPDETPRRTPLITWPFLPKAQDATTTQLEATALQTEAAMKASTRPKSINRRENLLRTSSFLKIRQFCNQGCDALMFLHASRSSLKATINYALVQAKACVLIFAVYLAVVVLSLQLTACLYMLAGKPVPAGLVFMVVSLFAIGGTFSKIIISSTKRKSRPSKRGVNISKKIE